MVEEEKILNDIKDIKHKVESRIKKKFKKVGVITAISLLITSVLLYIVYGKVIASLDIICGILFMERKETY